MRRVGDDYLKDECNQKPQVGKDADVKIFLDDELLTVQKREDHRDSHCGGIVERVEKGGGEKNLFFHAVLERGIYTKPHIVCQ